MTPIRLLLASLSLLCLTMALDGCRRQSAQPAPAPSSTNLTSAACADPNLLQGEVNQAFAAVEENLARGKTNIAILAIDFFCNHLAFNPVRVSRASARAFLRDCSG